MTGNNKLIYLYDDTNTPYGYIYNDTPYYYERNAQGDVVGLYYQNGIKIANYTYDAWGNVTSIINQYGEDVTGLPRHQGNLNPIRYRGYHYDAELEMYWLTTRFYNPEIGRFINADGQLNSGLFGNNLYAYCSNDSVNGHDPTGSCACMAGMFDCGHCQTAKTAFDKTQVPVSMIPSDPPLKEKTLLEKWEEKGVRFLPNASGYGGKIVNSYLVSSSDMTEYVLCLKSKYPSYFPGSVEGFVFEWDLHNIAYKMARSKKDKESARDLDVGGTIFSDSHG